MTPAQRLLVGGLAAVAFTSTSAALWLATRPPPLPATRTIDAEPYIAVAPGTPNALGELARSHGGPAVPKVDLGEDGPGRALAEFKTLVAPAQPGAAAGCVEAAGAWLVSHPEGGDAMTDPAVTTACVGAGTTPLTGRVRFATRPTPTNAGQPGVSCEVSIAYGWTDAAGKAQKPSVRGEASIGTDASACPDALQSALAEFRERTASP